MISLPTDKKVVSMRQSVDSYTLNRVNADQILISSLDDARRDLKTAGGVGFVKLETELLAKDIAYQGGNFHATNTNFGSVIRSKNGKSTDASLFRRPLVITSSVLNQCRDLQSNPNISRQSNARFVENEDGAVLQDFNNSRLSSTIED